MVLFMGRRIIQTEQRIKFFQALLRRNTSHFLRFIQNYNRAIGFNHIKRFSASKIVQFRPDTSCIFSTGIKCLNINNHDIHIRTLTKVVYLSQIL